MPAKLDRCVQEVKEDHSEDSAYAICQSSIKEAIERLDFADKSQAVGYPNKLQKEQREKKTGFHSLQNTPITGSLEELKREVGKMSAMLSASRKINKVYNYTNILRSALRAELRLRTAFEESEHPRDETGEFTDKGSGGGSSNSKRIDKIKGLLDKMDKGDTKKTSRYNRLKKEMDTLGGEEKPKAETSDLSLNDKFQSMPDDKKDDIIDYLKQEHDMEDKGVPNDLTVDELKDRFTEGIVEDDIRAQSKQEVEDYIAGQTPHEDGDFKFGPKYSEADIKKFSFDGKSLGTIMDMSMDELDDWRHEVDTNTPSMKKMFNETKKETKPKDDSKEVHDALTSQGGYSEKEADKKIEDLGGEVPTKSKGPTLREEKHNEAINRYNTSQMKFNQDLEDYRNDKQGRGDMKRKLDSVDKRFIKAMGDYDEGRIIVDRLEKAGSLTNLDMGRTQAYEKLDEMVKKKILKVEYGGFRPGRGREITYSKSDKLRLLDEPLIKPEPPNKPIRPQKVKGVKEYNKADSERFMKMYQKHPEDKMFKGATGHMLADYGRPVIVGGAINKAFSSGDDREGSGQLKILNKGRDLQLQGHWVRDEGMLSIMKGDHSYPEASRNDGYSSELVLSDFKVSGEMIKVGDEIEFDDGPVVKVTGFAYEGDEWEGPSVHGYVTQGTSEHPAGQPKGSGSHRTSEVYRILSKGDGKMTNGVNA